MNLQKNMPLQSQWQFFAKKLQNQIEHTIYNYRIKSLKFKFF